MSTRRVPRTADEQVADIEERQRRAAADRASDPKPAQFLFDHKGEILVAIGNNDPRPLPPGTEGQILRVRLADDLGLRWEDFPPPPFTGKGELLVGLSPAMQALLGPGDDGQVLMVDSGSPVGLRWADCSCSGGGGGGGGMGAMAFAVVNESTVVSDADVQTMSDAVGRQVVEHLAPAWNGLGATVTFYPGGTGDVPAGAIIVHVGDDSDIPGDAGYHTIAGDQPEAFVFAKTITDGGGGVLTAGAGFDTYCVAQVLSHEVCETYVDPHVSQLADDFATHAWIVEVGDVVSIHGYTIDGVQMSDFGLPSFFDPNGVAPYSYVGVPPAPFSLVPGSYLFRYDTSGGTTINGMVVPSEVLVADPHLLPGSPDPEDVALHSSVGRALRQRGLPRPAVRVVRGRGRGWSPGS